MSRPTGVEKWWGPVTPLNAVDLGLPEKDAERVSTPTGKKLPGDGLPTVRHLRWQDRAACKGQDLNMFVPEASRGPINEPMSFCAECPVLQECLDYAVENNEHGIWGGTTDRQREAIRAGHIHPCPEGCGREGYGKDNERCTPCANKSRGQKGRPKPRKVRVAA